MADSQPWSREYFALKLWRLRFRRLRLSQRAFAERFGLSYATVRDLEQQRSLPTRSADVLVEAIRLDPKLIETAAANVKADPEWQRFIDPK